MTIRFSVTANRENRELQMIRNSLCKFLVITKFCRFYLFISISDRVWLSLLMFKDRYVLTGLEKIEKASRCWSEYVVNGSIGMHNMIRSIGTVDYRKPALIADRAREKFRRDAAATNRREISGEIRGKCTPDSILRAFRASGNCVTLPDADIHRYLRITYAHEPSIRYLENRKAQSKQLLQQRRAVRSSLVSSLISPLTTLGFHASTVISPWFFSFSLSAVAPGIPEGSVYWEQFARPRRFRSNTTAWSATSCT